MEESLEGWEVGLIILTNMILYSTIGFFIWRKLKSKRKAIKAKIKRHEILKSLAIISNPNNVKRIKGCIYEPELLNDKEALDILEKWLADYSTKVTVRKRFVKADSCFQSLSAHHVVHSFLYRIGGDKYIYIEESCEI
jgi:hypothetical protein